MKYLMLTLINFIMVTMAKTQATFSKYYDPFNHSTEDVYSLQADNSTIYLSGRGLCNDFQDKCFKYAAIDYNGNLLTAYENETFETGYGFAQDSDYFYIDGGNEPYNTNVFLYRASKDGQNQEIINLTENYPKYQFIFNKGLVQFNEYIIVYGGFRDSTDIGSDNLPKAKGYQFWVNKSDLSIDTLMVVEPPLDFLRLDWAEADHSGHVVFACHVTDTITLPNKLFTYNAQVLLKYDQEKQVVWEWKTKDFLADAIYLSGEFTILDNDDIVINYRRSDDNDLPSLVCIDTMGQIRWSYLLSLRPYGKYAITRVRRTRNNDILITGEVISAKYNLPNTGFIAKLSKDGKFLWERYYVIERNKHKLISETYENYPLLGAFLDVIELPNGQLAAAGSIDNYYEDPVLGPRTDFDMWVVKTDSEGCLTPGCGTIQEIKNGEVLLDTCLYATGKHQWNYTPYSEYCVENTRNYAIIGDTLIKSRFCSVIAAIEDGHPIEESKLILYSEFDKVFFYEQDSFKLLYDFYPVRDEIVSFHIPQNYQYYDISADAGNYQPSTDEYQFIVDYVTFVKLGDTWLRKIVNHPIPNANGECHDMGDIIESIGGSHGFLGQKCHDEQGLGCESFLRCYTNDTTSYQTVKECEVYNAHQFVSERNLWYVVSSFDTPPYNISNIYTFSDSDSLVFNADINDYRRYRELLIINDEDKPIHTKILFREEGNQVYTWALPTDELVYDFSMNVGDTIHYDQFDDVDYIVSAKDSIELLDGSKRIAMNMGCYTDVNWIQGIGSFNGPFEPWYCCQIEYLNYISCFYRDGVQLYKNPWYDECFSVDTEDIALNNIVLYPNPASYSITISGIPEGKYTYRILNTQGQLVRSNTLQKEDNIDVSDLPSGMYFVELRNVDGQRWIEKFVIGR